MTASNTDRLYNLMEKRRVDRDGLPTQDTLDEIESALAGAVEFLIDPAALAVVKVANDGKANSITHEDVGRLILWADHIANHAESLVDAAAMVNVTMREAYPIAGGYDDEQGIFSDHGFVVDRTRAERVTRRFADTYSPSTGDLSSALDNLHKRMFG